MLPKDKWHSILRACRDASMVVSVHAEDDEIIQGDCPGQGSRSHRSPGSPGSAAGPGRGGGGAELIGLAEKSGCTIYIVHLSTGAACRLIRQARERNCPIMAETAPTTFSWSAASWRFERKAAPHDPASAGVPGQPDSLAGVADGVISVIATDHCAFTPGQRPRGRTPWIFCRASPGWRPCCP